MVAPAPLTLLVEELRRTRALVTPEELAHRLPVTIPTGLAQLDALLGGGLPEGRIVEVAQGHSEGFALAVQLLARCSAERLCALVDRADAFDPRSAAQTGLTLSRLFWCRPTSHRDAIRAADALLASGAFALVVLDLCGKTKRDREIPAAAWARLSKDALDTRTVLFVLGGAGAGAFAAAALEVRRRKARFLGQGRGRTFEGLELQVGLSRNKLGLPAGEARLLLRAPAHFPEEP